MKKILLYALLLLNLSLIFALWLSGSADLLTSSDSAGVLIALGRLFGLLAEACLVLQMVLIGRLPWVEQTFGHDRLVKVHRLIGFSLASFLLVHPLLLIIGYGQINGFSFWQQLQDFMANWQDVLKAVIGLAILAVVIIISLPVVRNRLRYEHWHFTHLFVYVAVLLILGHQTKAGDFIGQDAWKTYWLIISYAPFAALLLFRFLKPIYQSYRFGFVAAEVRQENSQVVSVYISGQHLDKFIFAPGQFANVTFLAKGFLTSHPFSFSDIPNSQSLRLTAKNVGDFTGRLKQLPLGTRVIIDGPLGRFTADSTASNKFLLIAGGIGITPVLSLAKALSKQKKDVKVMYAAKTAEDLALRQELVQTNVPLLFVLSQGQVPASETQAMSGHIDMKKIRQFCPDFQTRAVFICGPKAMIRDLAAVLKAAGVPSSRIRYERFDY